MNILCSKKDWSKGQAILLSIIVIGGVILGATTIAGFLTAVQLRQSNDAANSAKAIFAAETGINCGVYTFYHPSETRCGVSAVGSHWSISLGNGSSADFVCYAAGAATLDSSSEILCTDLDNPDDPNDRFVGYVYSRGTAGTATRAFLYTISP